MKLKKILCLALVCLVLCGCGKTKADGNMENALASLIWQDYETALTQSEAFLERMPENVDAQVIRQSAAWGLLRKAQPEIELSKGTYQQTDYGFVVENLPEKGRSDVQITGYWVGMDHSRETISDKDVETYFLRSITIYWTDGSGNTYTYDLQSPQTLQRKKLAKTILENPYSGDAADPETLEALASQAKKVVAPSVQDVLKQIEKKTGLTPEQLGFAAWNG